MEGHTAPHETPTSLPSPCKNTQCTEDRFWQAPRRCFSQTAMVLNKSQVCLRASRQRKTSSYRDPGKPCSSPAGKRFHLLRAAGTDTSQEAFSSASQRTKLSIRNLSQQKAMALVKPAAASTYSCRHRATAHQKQAQSSNSSQTSPFPSQALCLMAHARDSMFSACLNKHLAKRAKEKSVTQLRG